MNTETRAYLSFILAPNIGPKTFEILVKHFGTAELAWKGREYELKKAGLGPKTLHDFLEFREKFSAQDYERKLEDAQVEFIAKCEARYPKCLLKLPNPPIGLFCKGNIELLGSCHPGHDQDHIGLGSHLKIVDSGQARMTRKEQDSRLLFQSKRGNDTLKTIAVVGTRKTTSYGRQVTEKLVSELVVAGFTIVSGLALGVDAIAHRTAIENNAVSAGRQGLTIAVLGCGVDCASPGENTNLYNQILEQDGLIISEYPLSEPPKPGTFPARNRLIAALSKATLVTEAAADSGSLITADWAQKLGKKVFAVPGPITSRQSDGTAYLLKRGAKFVTSAQDILEELHEFEQTQTIQKKDFSRLNLTSEEQKIIKLLQDEPLSIDEIQKRISIPIFKLSPIISALELRSIIKNQGNRTFGLT